MSDHIKKYRGLRALLWLTGLVAVGCESGGNIDDSSAKDTGETSDKGDGEDNENKGGTDSDTDTDVDSDSDTDTDGDSDADSDVEDAGTDDGESCGETNFEVEFNKIDMLVVLDRSRSMADQGLWRPMCKALRNVTRDFETLVNFGLMLFPGPQCVMFEDGDGDNVCIKPSKPNVKVGAKDAVTKIAALLTPGTEESAEPCGGTPSAAVLEVAKSYLNTLTDEAKRFVLLATDGAPNCNSELTAPCTCVSDNCETQPLNCLDDAATYTASAALLTDGYPVYVLGMGGANEFADQQNEIAKVGGTEKYHSVEDPDNIAATLESITSDVVDCEFDVDWEKLGDDVDKDRRELVNFYCKVEVDDALSEKNLVGFDDQCGQNRGWTWVDERTVAFCDEACNKLKKRDCTKVAATFGCKSIVIY